MFVSDKCFFFRQEGQISKAKQSNLTVTHFLEILVSWGIATTRIVNVQSAIKERRHDATSNCSGDK